jgi:hypothetical protein
MDRLYDALDFARFHARALLVVGLVAGGAVVAVVVVSTLTGPTTSPVSVSTTVPPATTPSNSSACKQALADLHAARTMLAEAQSAQQGEKEAQDRVAAADEEFKVRCGRG